MEPDNVMDREDGTVRLVVFSLQGREYALPIGNVAEILPMVAIAPVPEAPAWLLGVVNLRGEVLPVVDLRARLDMPTRELDLNTPIIVAEHDGQGLGVVVDEVVEVLAVSTASVESPDEVVDSAQSVAAVVHSGDRLILTLDLQTLYAGAENLSTAPPKEEAVDSRA